jgi:hypothetical protein
MSDLRLHNYTSTSCGSPARIFYVTSGLTQKFTFECLTDTALVALRIGMLITQIVASSPLLLGSTRNQATIVTERPITGCLCVARAVPSCTYANYVRSLTASCCIWNQQLRQLWLHTSEQEFSESNQRFGIILKAYCQCGSQLTE